MGISSKQSFAKFFFYFMDYKIKWEWYTTYVYINKRNHYSTTLEINTVNICPPSPSSCRATTQF